VPRAGLSPEVIVDEAARLVDEAGRERLTLSELAKRFGVAQPSLYKHIKGLDGLNRLLAVRVLREVGETMRRVASHHQVFAITHLPQIAARAHHHILVSKGARGGVTTADVSVMGGDARVKEVARMLGGDPESELSRAHARELLDTATTTSPARATEEKRAPRSARA